ncbi:hypothetical protein [Streptomyces sp. NPDC026673]
MWHQGPTTGALERQVEGGDGCTVVAAAADVPVQPLTETIPTEQDDEAEI